MPRETRCERTVGPVSTQSAWTHMSAANSKSRRPAHMMEPEKVETMMRLRPFRVGRERERELDDKRQIERDAQPAP
eukprot:5509413-Pyramimonas_sp.AAC.1